MKLALVSALLLACGCPGHGGGQVRPYPEPKVADVVARLAKARDALTSFKADSTMDYWIGNQRAKGEVLVMGVTSRPTSAAGPASGPKIRFAALSPAGGSTLAEMACDGTNFVYVDYQNNCALTGPCDERSIEQFFRIALEPDDFLHLALGTPPVVPSPTGTVTWDGSNGHEKVDLRDVQGNTEKLTIDAREQRWDVLEAELAGPDGKVRWSVANTDFAKAPGSDAYRIPGKTRFKSPANKQDLLVEWGERQVNVEIPADKFVLEAPAGLPTCGQAAPASP